MHQWLADNLVNDDLTNTAFSPTCLKATSLLLYHGCEDVVKTRISNFLSGLEDQTFDLESLATLASAVFVSNEMKIVPSYVEKIKTVDKNVKVFNDINQTLIDSWINEATNGKLPSFSVKDTAIVLISSIILNGKFVNQFQESMTKEANFYSFNNMINKVQMMNQTVRTLYAKKVTSAKIVHLPFQCEGPNSFGLTIILPNSKTVKGVKIAALNYLNDKPKYYDEYVKLALPRFSIECDQELDFGYGSMYSMENLIGSNHLLNHSTLQKVRLNVDEKGAEFAAYVAHRVSKGMTPQSIEVNCNRPFIWAIEANVDKKRQILGIGMFNNCS